jgi:hypothetical protein
MVRISQRIVLTDLGNLLYIPTMTTYSTLPDSGLKNPKLNLSYADALGYAIAKDEEINFLQATGLSRA